MIDRGRGAIGQHCGVGARFASGAGAGGILTEPLGGAGDIGQRGIGRVVGIKIGIVSNDQVLARRH